MNRVCFGMSVILDPRNEVVDPDADTLEVHPKFEKAVQSREQLLAFFNKVKGVMSDSGRDLAEIDAAVAEAEAAI